MVQVRSMCRQPIKIVHRSNVQSLPLQNKVLNFGVPSLFPSLAIFSKPYHIRRWPHSRVIVWSCCVTLHIRRHWIIWLFNTIPYCVRCYNDHWILHDGTTREPFGTTSRRIAIKQVHWCRLAGFSLLAGHVTVPVSLRLTACLEIGHDVRCNVLIGELFGCRMFRRVRDNKTLVWWKFDLPCWNAIRRRRSALALSPWNTLCSV